MTENTNFDKWIEAIKANNKEQAFEIQHSFTDEDYSKVLANPNLLNFINFDEQNLYVLVNDQDGTIHPTDMNQKLRKAYERLQTRQIKPEFKAQTRQNKSKSDASLTLEQKYNHLKSIVGSLGADIKRVRDAETIGGANYYVAKMNKIHPGKYEWKEADIDGDGVNEILVNKKYYDPSTKTYTDFKPYIVNGWKLAPKDDLRQTYIQDVQNDLGFGRDRIKARKDWSKNNNGEKYPDYNKWKKEYLYTETQIDKENPFEYKVERGNLDSVDYDILEAHRPRPQTITKTARGVFVKSLSDLIKKNLNEEGRRNLYEKNNGFMAFAANIYKALVSDPVESQLKEAYNISDDDEKTLKKYKNREEYKNHIKEVVKYYLTPKGENELIDYVVQFT